MVLTGERALRDQLKLEMSEEKTLVTHANEGAKFLGYVVRVLRSETRPVLNGRVELRLPPNALDSACSRYTRAGKPRP
jgi:hypothetical protein